MTQEKKELLNEAIEQGNEYDFISWDGLLDLCDEDMKLVNWLDKKLTKMKEKGKIDFELDW
jgi:hypothetical protein